MRGQYKFSLAVPVLALLGAANGAVAQPIDALSNSAAYNSGFGMMPGGENQGTTGSSRDANGNRVIVNGIMAGAAVSRQDGVKQSGTPTSGAGAVAIGNSLNVAVTGSHNTVIVDSTQVNNGDQNAEISLNGELQL